MTVIEDLENIEGRGMTLMYKMEKLPLQIPYAYYCVVPYSFHLPSRASCLDLAARSLSLLPSVATYLRGPMSRARRLDYWSSLMVARVPKSVALYGDRGDS